MNEQLRTEKTRRYCWEGKALAIVAAAIVGFTILGNAQAAEKDGPMVMGSMEMHQSMMKGMKEMETMPATGDTDYDFAMMMKKHHQSALDMAGIELQKGKDPTLRSMAKAIITSQKKEIKEFDQWLARHKQPVTQPMSKSK